MVQQICFVDLAGMLGTAAHLRRYFEIGQADISRIAQGIASLLREDAAQPVGETEIDKVVEAACRRPEMPDRIEALDYVGAAVQSSVRSLLAEPAIRCQRAEIQQQLLLQVQDCVLYEPPGESSPQPPADPQGVAFEEFAKIFRDKEAVLSDIAAVPHYRE